MCGSASDVAHFIKCGELKQGTNDMPIIPNFEHPCDFYGENGNLSLEDWLANFYVEADEVFIETPPPTESNPGVMVGKALYLPTKLGELTITRAMLVDLFTEEEVVKQELDASIAYLENLT
jgi:hypothetical protein